MLVINNQKHVIGIMGNIDSTKMKKFNLKNYTEISNNKTHYKNRCWKRIMQHNKTGKLIEHEIRFSNFHNDFHGYESIKFI